MLLLSPSLRAFTTSYKDMDKTLGDRVNRGHLGNSQIRESIAHSWIVGGATGSERTLLRFSDCKRNGGRIVLSHMQDII